MSAVGPEGVTTVRRVRNRVLKAAALVGVSISLVVATIGPSNVASALGASHDAPWDKVLPFPAPGWRVSNTPLHITAPTAEIYGLSQVVPGARVQQANGQWSDPDTYYLKVRKLELDDIRITSEHADHTWSMANPNGGKKNKSTTFTIGNDDKATQVGLWVQITTLKLCITPQTLDTIIYSERGQLGGRLDELIQLVHVVFEPYVHGPLQNVGPCIPIKELLPIVGVLLEAGIPLPELPVIKLDLHASAVKVETKNSLPSVQGPVAQVRMFQP